MPRKDGHATGMAGEFFVMEQLFRLGHLPALTLGNAKTVDIFVKTTKGTYQVSVKSIRGGGKWGVGQDDYSSRNDLIFVLLRYDDFDNLKAQPTVHVIPARKVQELKKPWFDQFAIYYSHYKLKADIKPFKDAWEYFPQAATDI
jgi:hypothetical protein